MQTLIPKQFLKVDNCPVVIHSMLAFYRYNADCKQILVLPESQLKKWEEIRSEFPLPFEYEIALGGETRFHSVKNGLSKINENEGMVAVHDAVRMLVEPETISMAFKQAIEVGTAIPFLKIKDSIRSYKDDISLILNRDEVIRIQTPQVFRLGILKKAYQQEFDGDFTDDASLVEKLGIKLNFFEGKESNLKITEPIDLLIAEAILKSRNSSAFPTER